jgi:DNA-binding transcriptional LysR family regulator
VDGASPHVARRSPDETAGRPRSGIRSQDLVSVPVLRAILRERSVTRAADVVGLTQPAVSHALARLRRRLGDDLLIRVGREYQLTPLGQSLLDRAENVYDALERLFDQDFDPASSTRRFTLVQSDYTMVLLAEPLTRILRAEAPGVRLSFQQLTTTVGDFQDPLRQSDGVIVPPGHIRGHPSTKLLTDRWVCVVAEDNPHVGATLTIDDLARLPWVASYDQTVLSAAAPLRHMRSLGVEPQVEVSVEGFLAVPSLIAGTDRIAFIHEKLIQRLPRSPAIRVVPSPLPTIEHIVALYWDASATNDPGHQWFRDVLRRAAAAVDADDRRPVATGGFHRRLTAEPGPGGDGR